MKARLGSSPDGIQSISEALANESITSLLIGLISCGSGMIFSFPRNPF